MTSTESSNINNDSEDDKEEDIQRFSLTALSAS
eukprot:CAMPEP_0170900782 /NCGR_PEP_ID=MMETSP0734-20130129/47799_1 /TAXON_ID=186038 /ORGANISM="Fragilariopsis kerguelensis, Strain L26-C5" /LENGTH=32 /DNA_ID= /DNA_START= /DNA_END= /DNA_ORIENTATION=